MQDPNPHSPATMSAHRLYLVIICASLVMAALALSYFIFRAPQTAPPATSLGTAAVRALADYGRVPLSFEANQGQVDGQVKFLTRTNGQSLYLTPTEAVLDLRGKQERSAVRMQLVGANPTPAMRGEDPLPGTTNYFLGDDPKAWRTNIPTYKKVKYERVYPGVDVVYYGNQQELEYDFIVQPGADPHAIQLRFAGAENLRLDEAGNLVLTTTAGEVVQHKPIIYQEADGKRAEIAGNYVLRGEREVGFAVSEYDASQALVIDPVLSYATFFGPGPGTDVDKGYNTQATRIVVDKEGCAYITGIVQAPEFPVSGGAIRPLRMSQDDTYAFIAKFNPQGSSVLYSAVLGGNSRPGAMAPFGMAIDEEGNAYLTGWNAWRDFPRTRGVFSSLGGVFVTKLNPTGTELVFSTVLGGDGFSEEGSGITVDQEHNVYVTGHSDSKRFPVTTNAYQKENAGWSDGFVLKLKPDASQLLFSTLIGGGTSNTVINPIVDAEGNVYFSGHTDGIENGIRSDYKPFPTTPGAFLSSTDPQVLRRGGAYVAKLNATGSDLIFATMVPGGGRMVIDKSGYIYLGGGTSSNDFPTTPGAYRRRGGTEDRSNLRSDAVITKFTPDASRLIYSTFVGGNEESAGASGIAVDAQGNTYITGMAPRTGFPFTTVYAPAEPPFPSPPNREGGGFVTKLNADGSGLVYSVYIPHARPDGGIALDTDGNAYITGSAREQLPTTENAYQQFYQNSLYRGAHAFIAKVANVTTPERPLALIYPFPVTENPNADLTYKAGGRVKDEWGRPVEGVNIAINATGVAEKWLALDEIKWNWTIGVNGAMTSKAVTDSGGYYAINSGYPPGATYTFTPSKPGYTFSPASVTLNRLGKNQIVSFTATSSISPRLAVNVSAASYEKALSYNCIVSAFGSDLATKTQSATTLPLPTNLGGTTVLVRDLTGIERYAPLFFVSPTQVNYLLPSGIYAGRAIVTIRNANGIESTEFIQVEELAPALFSADATGRGVAAANVQRVRANGTQSYENVSQFDVSRGHLMPIPIDLGAAGDNVYLALFGTGVRNCRTLSNVSATVGGMRALVTYAGSQNGYAGLDQINVMIPRELAGRGEVDVVVNVEGKPANVVKIKIK